MAIPTWTWAEHDVAGRDSAPRCESDRGLKDGTDVVRASSEFELLSSPVRLEILITLADRDEPIRYTDLRTATAIDDNGKLNYHLRQLEAYVSSDDGRYRLTMRGRRLLNRML